jgi:hypothetical protein
LFRFISSARESSENCSGNKVEKLRQQNGIFCSGFLIILNKHAFCLIVYALNEALHHATAVVAAAAAAET